MRILKAIILIVLLTSAGSAQQDDKMRLAIIDLSPQMVDPGIATMVSDLLRTELFNTGLFRVIERGEMQSILKEQEFQMSGCTETECAVQMGKLLSAKKMLVGTLGKLGETFIINARIVDVEKGEMEFADNASVESEGKLPEAVKEFANKLANKINAQSKVVEVLDDPKSDDSKKYTELISKGIEEYKDNNYDDAIEIWEDIPEDVAEYDSAQTYISRAKYKKQELKKQEEAKKAEVADTDLEQDAPRSFGLFWNLELGAGDMVGTYVSIGLNKLKRFQVGLGGSFTYQKDENFGVEFSEYYYTFAGLVSFRVIEYNSIWLNIRERIGKQFIQIGEYDASGWTLSSDLMIGYKGFFGEIAMPVFLGSEGSDISVTMGVGYQLQLY